MDGVLWGGSSAKGCWQCILSDGWYPVGGSGAKGGGDALIEGRNCFHVAV